MRSVISAIASRTRGKYLAQIALVCAAQFAAGKVGDALKTVNDGGVGPVWPASGVALAALLLWDYSVWPGVAAGAFLLAFFSPLPHWAAVLYAAGTTLASVIAVFFLRWITKFDNSLSHLRDALGLIILGAFVSSIVSASIGASILFANLRSWSGLGSAWLVYWLGDSTGVLLLAPVALTFPDVLRIRDRKRIEELALLLVLLIIGGFIVFGDFPLARIKLHILTFAVLPFVMWAAIRLGVSATALSIFVIGTVATVATALGSGPFTTNTPIMNAVLLDVFFAVVSITGLILAAAIAEREQAEREREQLVRERAEADAQLRFAAIVESSEDAIISGTLDGIIISWNASAQRIYGYTEAEVVGKPITILVPPERPDEEKRIFETLRAGGNIEHFETVRVTKAGKRINVSLCISPIRDSSGKTVGCCGIARDITKRKLAEQALAESEERFRLAVQAGKMYAYTWDVASDVISRSGDVARVLGSTGETSLTRQQLAATVHPDDKALFATYVSERTPEDPDVQISYRSLRLDGSVVWLQKTAHALFDKNGRVVRMIGMVADITEQKRAEEAIHESEERFRLVANTSPVMIWMSGADKRPTYFNQRWLDFSGLSEAELKNGLAEIVHPDDYKQGQEVYCRGFDQLQPFRKECRLRRHDGQYRWMLDIGVPRYQKDGCFAGYIGSCVDVTDRKLAEEALADMSRKLIEAQEQERARIARELHDDISQRLATLAIELEQLKQNPFEVEGRLQELQKHTSEISKDLQALSHDLHSSQLEYLGAVAGIKSWCREFGERREMQIDFRHDVRNALPQAVGLCLFRVLQEALHNAAKHSGVKRIEVQLHEESGEIHLIIMDLGNGFDVEAVKQGKGLGLTSMRQRVRLVNGTIDIQSKPMGGTTIHVRVPELAQRLAG
jgi:PAS domain S-box-containing protein